MNEELLQAWRKGHAFKVKLALTLRRETTVTVSWIAERLQILAIPLMQRFRLYQRR